MDFAGPAWSRDRPQYPGRQSLGVCGCFRQSAPVYSPQFPTAKQGGNLEAQTCHVDPENRAWKPATRASG